MVFIQREFLMSVYLKRYGFAITKFEARNTGISGSARFVNIRSWFDRELQVKTKVYKRDDADGEKAKKVKSQRRTYGVDKSKLMDRLNAYVMLKRSRKFLAFYSVSVPAGNSDESVKRLWNSCLTSLREKLNLRSYIWVMERQGNGTMHYHMLTNDYMPVRGVNQIVASCIQQYVEKGLMHWGQSSIVKYNGVDVVNISKRAKLFKGGSTRKAYEMTVRYVTKYMSKNSEQES